MGVTSLLIGLVAAIVVFGVPVVSVVGIGLWVRWLRRHWRIPRFAMWIAYALIVASALQVAFSFVPLVGALMVTSGSAVESAATRQRVLASGIAEAFYNGVFGLVVVTLGALWLGFCTWRFRGENPA